MKKYVLSILSIFICVSSMAGLPSDTTYYYYHDNTFDSMIEKDTSIDDEVIMIVSEGNKKSCFF